MRTLKPKTNKQLAVIRSSCFYILMPAHRAHALLTLSLSLSSSSLSAPKDLRYFSCRQMPVKRRPRISCLIFVESVSIFCPSRSFPPFRANLSRLNFHVLESNFVLSRMIATSLVRIHVSIGETLFIRPGGRQALCGEFAVPFQNNSDLYKAIHGDATRLQISVNENERTYCFAA